MIRMYVRGDDFFFDFFFAHSTFLLHVSLLHLWTRHPHDFQATHLVASRPFVVNIHTYDKRWRVVHTAASPSSFPRQGSSCGYSAPHLHAFQASESTAPCKHISPTEQRIECTAFPSSRASQRLVGVRMCGMRGVSI